MALEIGLSASWEYIIAVIGDNLRCWLLQPRVPPPLPGAGQPPASDSPSVPAYWPRPPDDSGVLRSQRSWAPWDDAPIAHPSVVLAAAPVPAASALARP